MPRVVADAMRAAQEALLARQRAAVAAISPPTQSRAPSPAARPRRRAPSPAPRAAAAPGQRPAAAQRWPSFEEEEPAPASRPASRPAPRAPAPGGAGCGAPLFALALLLAAALLAAVSSSSAAGGPPGVCALPFPTLEQLMQGCVCPAGTTRGSSLGGCEPCGTNSARALRAGAGRAYSGADEGCAPCLPWEWAPRGSASCLACPAGRTRAWRFGEVPGAVCLPCERNEFLSPATRKCAECAPDTFSAPGATQCQACPEGHVRAVDDAECDPCPRNTYKSGTTTCSYCGEHAYSRPAKGARSIAECVCQKGAYRPAAGRPCERCPDGLFKNVTGTDDACLAPRSGYMVNKAQDGEVANSVTFVGSVLRSITFAISEAFEGVLKQLYEALFGDAETIRREIQEELAREDGRHTEENAWESAAPETPASEDCPFASAEAVWASVRASKDFSELRGLRRCTEIKAAFKRLVLKFHPDKFNYRFKGCDNDLSMLATRELLSAYEARSKSCA